MEYFNHFIISKHIVTTIMYYVLHIVGFTFVETFVANGTSKLGSDLTLIMIIIECIFILFMVII